jgi:hypothetical protein
MRTGDRALDLSYPAEPGQTLAVFPDGAPDDALNHTLHETFIKIPPFERYESLPAWQTRREALLERLRNEIFANLPNERPPLDIKIRTGPHWSWFDEITYTSEPGIRIRGFMQRPEKPENVGQPVPGLLYVASPGEDHRDINQLMRSVKRRDASVRLAIFPRGVGRLPWDKVTAKDMLKNAMHVGQTVDSLRLFDVMRGLDALRATENVDPDRIMVVGRGVSGILGLYAALLDESVQQVTLIKPPESHRDGPTFLNILRALDLPEAAALLAPRRLNFFGHTPPAYAPVRHVYSLYGQPNHIHETLNLERVLEGDYRRNFPAGL